MKRLQLLLLSLIFVPFFGCSSDELNRTTVTGTVTLDGNPIENGWISFKPESGTQCPDIAGQIKNGTFSIPKKDGPVIGSYTVNITSSMRTGKKVKEPVTGIETDEIIEIIPARYNGQHAGMRGLGKKSSLTATIEKGKNDLKFDLVSDPKN
jgi:hypothetical protein